MAGVFEVDESYFDPDRVRGKCGRGASGKTIVFGIRLKLFTKRNSGQHSSMVMSMVFCS